MKALTKVALFASAATLIGQGLVGCGGGGGLTDSGPGTTLEFSQKANTALATNDPAKTADVFRSDAGLVVLNIKGIITDKDIEPSTRAAGDYIHAPSTSPNDRAIVTITPEKEAIIVNFKVTPENTATGWLNSSSGVRYKEGGPAYPIEGARLKDAEFWSTKAVIEFKNQDDPVIVYEPGQKLNTALARNNFAEASTLTGFTATLPVQTGVAINTSAAGTFYHKPKPDVVSLVRVTFNDNYKQVEQAILRLDTANTVDGYTQGLNTLSSRENDLGQSAGARPLTAGAHKSMVDGWADKFGTPVAYPATTSLLELDAAAASKDALKLARAVKSALATQGIEFDAANIVVGPPSDAILDTYATPRNKFTHIAIVQESSPSVQTLYISGNFGSSFMNGGSAQRSPDFLEMKVINGQLFAPTTDGAVVKALQWPYNASTNRDVNSARAGLENATKSPATAAAVRFNFTPGR